MDTPLGVCIWGRGALGRPPLELEKQAVRILLECFLVFNMDPLLANEFLSYYFVIPCYKSVPRDPICSIQPRRKCGMIHVSRNIVSWERSWLTLSRGALRKKIKVID